MPGFPHGGKLLSPGITRFSREKNTRFFTRFITRFFTRFFTRFILLGFLLGSVSHPWAPHKLGGAPHKLGGAPHKLGGHRIGHSARQVGHSAPMPGTFATHRSMSHQSFPGNSADSLYIQNRTFSWMPHSPPTCSGSIPVAHSDPQDQIVVPSRWNFNLW